MTGRDKARELLGLARARGQAAEEERLPTTPEDLREITGLTWQPMDIPVPRIVEFWDPRVPEWWTRPNGPLWEEGLGFGTRYKGGIILYGALPETYQRHLAITDRFPVLGWTVTQSHPELDERAARDVFDRLNAAQLRPALYKTDSELFRYIIEITWLTGFVTVRNTTPLNIAEKVTIHQYAIDLLERERNGGRS